MAQFIIFEDAHQYRHMYGPFEAAEPEEAIEQIEHPVLLQDIDVYQLAINYDGSPKHWDGDEFERTIEGETFKHGN